MLGIKSMPNLQGLQLNYDIEKAKQVLADVLPGIHPFNSDCLPFNSGHSV
jgi:hypothetical protein